MRVVREALVQGQIFIISKVILDGVAFMTLATSSLLKTLVDSRMLSLVAIRRVSLSLFASGSSPDIFDVRCSISDLRFSSNTMANSTNVISTNVSEIPR